VAGESAGNMATAARLMTSVAFRIASLASTNASFADDE
jgi:hypothetical protein